MVRMEGSYGVDCHKRLDRGLYVDYICVEIPQQLLQPAGHVPPPPLKMVAAYFLMEDSDSVHLIPGSHLSGRAPRDGELSFDGKAPRRVGGKAGDVLLIRCDTWRQDSPTGAGPSHYLRVDYAERNIAQRFLAGPSSLAFEYNSSVVAAANAVQKRMLGKRAHGACEWKCPKASSPSHQPGPAHAAAAAAPPPCGCRAHLLVDCK